MGFHIGQNFEGRIRRPSSYKSDRAYVTAYLVKASAEHKKQCEAMLPEDPEVIAKELGVEVTMPRGEGQLSTAALAALAVAKLEEKRATEAAAVQPTADQPAASETPASSSASEQVADIGLGMSVDDEATAAPTTAAEADKPTEPIPSTDQADAPMPDAQAAPTAEASESADVEDCNTETGYHRIPVNLSRFRINQHQWARCPLFHGQT